MLLVCWHFHLDSMPKDPDGWHYLAIHKSREQQLLDKMSSANPDDASAVSALLMKGRLKEDDRVASLHGGSLVDVDESFDIDFGLTTGDSAPKSSKERANVPSNNTNGKRHNTHVDFLKDSPNEMTFGRRIALSLIHAKWYNPKAGQKEPAKLNLEATTVTTPKQSGSGGGVEPEPELITSTEYPSLLKAWAYFEHVALSRHLCDDTPKPKKNIFYRIWRRFRKGDQQLQRAEPGERDLKTKLYSPLWTPHSQVCDLI
jgi:hypothetical protein